MNATDIIAWALDGALYCHAHKPASPEAYPMFCGEECDSVPTCDTCHCEIEGANVLSSGPGKFEGEPAYTRHFWDESLSGSADDEWHLLDDTLVSVFYPSDSDRRRFPALATAYCVCVAESDQGFVSSLVFASEAEYEAHRAAVEVTNA